ncbi:DNA recombination protein RmuC [Chloroflexota bacterium]
MTEILLAIILASLLLLIFLILRSRRVKSQDVESAILNVWRESGLDKTVGELTTCAQDIRKDYRSLDQMLRVPKERASLGEISLETILSDQLPPEMFGIRQRILEGIVPDACIRSTVGMICIDSKFPLDNYRKMVEAEEIEEKESFKRQFIKDVQAHLDKIANDYVCPEKGSAEFAFAYIPSEGVYYFLVNEAYDRLRNYTKVGVQVVSPLTLSHKIELIKAGAHAKKLSEDADKVSNNLIRISRRFTEIDEIWRVFYRTHLKNLEGKAVELDEAYNRLREEFERVSKISQGD